MNKTLLTSALLYLHDTDGRHVASIAVAGNQTHVIDTTQFRPGMYTVRATGSETSAETTKIIIR